METGVNAQRHEPQLDTVDGTIRSVVVERGFGFITGDDGEEYFFHMSAAEEFELLTPGVAVRFVPSEGPKGLRAEHVERRL
jgi:cold shock CspA family protein